MANADRNFGNIENNAGLMVGYVDRDGVERDLAGNPLAPGARPATAGLPRVVGQSAVAASVTGTTNETTLATILIPAGALGVNGSLRITTLWSYTNSANNKTIQVKFGGTAFFSAINTTTASYNDQTIIRNRSVSTQVAHLANAGNRLGSSGSAPTTGAIDTAVAQTVTITGTLASAGETITLEGYTVEILNP